MAPFDDKFQHRQKTRAHFCASTYRFRDIKLQNLWPSKNRSTPRSIILAMTSFDGKCQNLQKTLTLQHIFALALAVSEILRFQMFGLEKVGQGYGPQLSQWRHSIVNIKSYKIYMKIISALYLIVNEIWKHLKSWTETQEISDTAAAESLTIGR